MTPARITDDMFEAWCRRREREGSRVDLLELYDIVAAQRGVEPEDIPLPERNELAQRALKVTWPGFEQVAALRTGDHVEVAAYQPDWVDRFQT
jgi:hypothetical protein